MTSNVPTLYEWIGGLPALNRLTERFYERVRDDQMLAPIFAEMSPEHPKHVATFLAEVLGGPIDYSSSHGGHSHMTLTDPTTVLPRRASMVTSLSLRLGDPNRPAVKKGTDVPLVGTCNRIELANASEGFSRNSTRPPPATEVALRRKFTTCAGTPAGLVTRMRHGAGAHAT